MAISRQLANKKKKAANKKKALGKSIKTISAVKLSTAAPELSTGAQILPIKSFESGRLSVADIRDILSTCKACGVLSFQYSGLCINFNKIIDDPIRGLSQNFGKSSGRSLLPPRELDDAELDKADSDVSLELEHLKITDPAAYEDFILSEDASDG